ncbi:MAG: type II toxin-antitoxin system Phd/YefM family antitoxin [Streptococcaceae bacterium]|nr:type II toxin-antitoxin system Phd/YefM family antitoxin [Streptococcaceae bacterium]
MGFSVINGLTVSATDVRKSWTKILKSVQENRKPAFVFTNNTPEAVVLAFEDYQIMQTELEVARRSELARQMTEDLLDIAKLEQQSIPRLQVAEDGAFYETRKSD